MKLRPQNPRVPSRNVIRAMFLTGTALILAGVLLFLQQRISRELARPLGPTLPPFPSATPQAFSQPAARDGTQVPQQTPPTTPRRQAANTPLCGGPEQMVILAVGSDARFANSPVFGLADVMRVVRVDFSTPSVSMLAIPRDVWVEIPGLQGYGNPQSYFGYPTDKEGQAIVQSDGSYARLNASYFYGNLYQIGGGGPRLLAETIYHNFGLPADHYVVINLDVFSRLVDQIGGIDIYVPYDIKDFSAGNQHMNGTQVSDYVRIREPDSDFDRIDLQTDVLLALRQELLRPDALRQLPSLVDTFLAEVSTDLSKADIASLVCVFSKIDRESITTYTIGPQMLTPNTTTEYSFVLLPDENQIRQLVSDFLNGSLPQP